MQRRLALRAVWQRRTATGWSSIVVARTSSTAKGAARIAIPTRVSHRVGTYRVRVFTTAKGAALPSAWQYLRLR